MYILTQQLCNQWVESESKWNILRTLKAEGQKN